MTKTMADVGREGLHRSSLNRSKSAILFGGNMWKDIPGYEGLYKINKGGNESLAYLFWFEIMIVFGGLCLAAYKLWDNFIKCWLENNWHKAQEIVGRER